jgi:hypothetical protein
MTQQATPPIGFFGKITEIRKWVMLFLIALVLFFGYKYFAKNKSETIVE